MTSPTPRPTSPSAALPGAMTCAELAAVGLPALYVPAAHRQRRKQRLNALPVVDAGEGSSTTPRSTASAVHVPGHLLDAEQRRAMGNGRRPPTVAAMRTRD